MPHARLRATSPVTRFFQFSVLGVAASGFCALAGAGSLGWPILAFSCVALALRAAMVAGWIGLVIPPRAIALAALTCTAFFAVDLRLLSRDFFTATLHGVCLLAAVKFLTARTRRDYVYTGAVAFVQLTGAALISFHANFFAWFALYLVCGLAALMSAEIEAGLERGPQVVRPPKMRAGRRLGALAVAAAVSVIAIAAGLFLTLPRTARAAAMLFPGARHLTGYTNVVDLGVFGGIGRDTHPVMHILSYTRPLPPGLRWRGTALSRFDGKRWSEPPLPVTDLISSRGTVEAAGPLQRSRRDARRFIYRVDLNSSDTGTLFIAGIPEFLNVASPRLVRTAEDSFRVLPVTGEPLEYEVSAHPGPPLPVQLTAGERARYLRLPPVDGRIWRLARGWAGSGDPLAQALRIEEHLRRDYAYRLDGPPRPVRDPLGNFLFVSKSGYCEYFASAMAVMLRTLGTPSRVVTGFQSGYYNDVSGMYVVRASDAHAWVEGWFEGRGWVTLDATPIGSPPAPGLLSRVGVYLDAADSMWQQWVAAYDPGHQAMLAARLADRLRSFSSRRTRPWSWRPLMVPAAVSLGLMLMVWAAVRWLPAVSRQTRTRAHLWRIARRGGSAGDGRALYEHMLAAVERRGYRKPAWFTPLEFARTLPAEEREKVAQFTSLYNDLRFGGNTEAAGELAQLLRDFRA